MIFVLGIIRLRNNEANDSILSLSASSAQLLRGWHLARVSSRLVMTVNKIVGSRLRRIVRLSMQFSPRFGLAQIAAIFRSVVSTHTPLPLAGRSSIVFVATPETHRGVHV